MKLETIYLGTTRSDYMPLPSQSLTIEKHTWACDWHWQFGWMGNTRFHGHFNSLFRANFDGWWPAIRDVFVEPHYTEAVWYKIFDLMKQAYILKDAAEIYRYGGNITASKGARVIRDDEMVARINNDLKNVLDTVWNVLNTESI